MTIGPANLLPAPLGLMGIGSVMRSSFWVEAGSLCHLECFNFLVAAFLPGKCRCVYFLFCVKPSSYERSAQSLSLHLVSSLPCILASFPWGDFGGDSRWKGKGAVLLQSPLWPSRPSSSGSKKR